MGRAKSVSPQIREERIWRIGQLLPKRRTGFEYRVKRVNRHATWADPCGYRVSAQAGEGWVSPLGQHSQSLSPLRCYPCARSGAVCSSATTIALESRSPDPIIRGFANRQSAPWTERPLGNPPGSVAGKDRFAPAGVAQLAEHDVANVVVVGSNPITRS